MKLAAHILHFVLSVICINQSLFAINHNDINDRIKGSIFGGLIGDAHGKSTEFIMSLDAIFEKFPGGIDTFDDLKKFNLTTKDSESGTLYARYTDDTAMARVTIRVLLESRRNNWDLNHTMSQLAVAYAQDACSPTGWKMADRAPGNGCIKSISIILARLAAQPSFVSPGLPAWQTTAGSLRSSHGIFEFSEDGRASCSSESVSWWHGGDTEYMGCGSVMRAHSFGLVFADDPEKAATWAAEHSKITHGHPAAQAACAAMAVGVAYAVQGKDTKFVIDQMIAWAKKYDPIVARINSHTGAEDLSTWKKIEHAVDYANMISSCSIHTPKIKHYINNPKVDRCDLNYLINGSEPLFEKYLGWAADDAIAAAVYLFALLPDRVSDAIYLGVHTPGDSDSIASMAGALVGARVGAQELQKHHNMIYYEGSRTLEQYADDAAQLVTRKK